MILEALLVRLWLMCLLVSEELRRVQVLVLVLAGWVLFNSHRDGRARPACLMGAVGSNRLLLGWTAFNWKSIGANLTYPFVALKLFSAL